MHATRPTGAATWDVTKLRTPAKGVVRSLHTVLDTKVVGTAAELLVHRNVRRSHNRPRLSNDNRFFESA